MLETVEVIALELGIKLERSSTPIDVERVTSKNIFTKQDKLQMEDLKKSLDIIALEALERDLGMDGASGGTDEAAKPQNKHDESATLGRPQDLQSTGQQSLQSAKRDEQVKESDTRCNIEVESQQQNCQSVSKASDKSRVETEKDLRKRKKENADNTVKEGSWELISENRKSQSNLGSTAKKQKV